LKDIAVGKGVSNFIKEVAGGSNSFCFYVAVSFTNNTKDQILLWIARCAESSVVGFAVVV
jgi:hypothetical protein